RFLVVPQDEPDRTLGLHVGHAEDARQFHYERRPGAVVVGRFPPPDSIHVRTDDVHLLRTGGADFGAVDLLPLAVHRRFAIQLAGPPVGLRVGVVLDPRGAGDAPQARPALPRPHLAAADHR